MGFLSTDIARALSWNDVFPAFVSVGSGTATPTIQVYRDTPVEYQFLRRDQDDSFQVIYQMPHTWAKNAVNPHMHFIGCGDSDGYVVVSGVYTWSGIGHALPANADWTAFRAEKYVLGSDQWIEEVLGIGPINPPSWAGPSAQLHIRWTRPGSSDAGDTYHGNNPFGLAAANVALLALDCHVQIKTLGTMGEFS